MELTLEIRKKRLSDLKKVIKTHEVLIQKAIKDDLGKSNFESYMVEIGFILEEINHAIKHIDSWVKPKKVRTPLSLFPGRSYIYPSPYGTVLIISPWNYPFQLTMGPLIGAIASGNHVVIKPSEFAPHTSNAMKAILQKVFQGNEVQYVEGGVEVTQALLKQKFDYIFFTGSTEVGKVVMRAAAENLTPVTLELGGKSPLLIEESANIDLAAKRCIWGKSLNAGQSCVAPDYVLVPEHLQEQFIERAKHYINVFFGQDSLQSENYARIINHKHFDRLEQFLTKDKIAVGGSKSRDDKFIAPTILKNVSWNDSVMEGEIFGPILPVLTYKNIEIAVQDINARPKPLAFYLFSENKAQIEKIISKVSFGGGCINDTMVHLGNPNLPFGGVGASGMGSYHGKKSFETFTHYKAVFKQGFLDIPIKYPPYKGKLGWLKFFLK